MTPCRSVVTRKQSRTARHHRARGARRTAGSWPLARSSFVLLLVLVLIAGASAAALVITTSALGHRQEWSACRDREAARLLALGGLERVLAEVSSQHDLLLAGAAPTLTTEWSIPVALGPATQLRGTVRLRRVFIDPTVIDGASAGFAEPQAAFLDANSAPREMLARLAGLEREQLDTTLRARDLSNAPMVWLGPGGAALDNEGRPAARPLALTCYAFEVDRTAGVAGLGLLSPGEARIPLGSSQATTPDGDGGGGTLSPADEALMTVLIRAALTTNRRDLKPSWVARQLSDTQTDPSLWGCVLDAAGFATDGSSDEPGFRAGLIDLNRASTDVLACIPGITPLAAASIVDRRRSLSPETARSVAWPLTEGLLTPDQFTQAVDHLTTRSLVWRVEIEAGFEPTAPDRPDDSAGPEELTHPYVLEAVIDGNWPRARTAALREITSREAARDLRAFIAAAAAPSVSGRAPESPESSEEFAPPAGDPPTQEPDSARARGSRGPGSIAPGPDSDSTPGRAARHGRWLEPPNGAARRPAAGYIQSPEGP